MKLQGTASFAGQNGSSSSTSSPEREPSVDDETTRADCERTTIMLRNIPAEFTRDELIKLLDTEGFAGTYDFVYLPVDFAHQAIYGYASST